MLVHKYGDVSIWIGIHDLNVYHVEISKQNDKYYLVIQVKHGASPMNLTNEERDELKKVLNLTHRKLDFDNIKKVYANMSIYQIDIIG